ncbi:hypothetical protein ACH4PU_30600 [Streptomyces sp. NPDC021100]|uniref:hypothetical protein n=1 Tax=Streptomyces sp. NPDC021100 TaxID=3365114 RepID=UPI0037A9A305
MSQPIPAPRTASPVPAASRALAARRLAVRVLDRIARYSDPVLAALFGVTIGLQATHTGPAWIADMSDGTLLLVGFATLGVFHLVQTVTGVLTGLITPACDHNVVTDIQGIADLRADIENGAALEDLLDDLRRGNAVNELSDTVSALSHAYAEDSDDEAEIQNLRAADLHLRKAATYLNYPSELDALEAGGEYRISRP